MSGNKPISMTEQERAKFEKIAKQAKDTGVLGTSYKEGDKIKVIDGPFLNFEGKFDKLDLTSGKATVVISVFGRATAVELPIETIERLS